MSDTTILNTDIGVTWLASDRNKRLDWEGGGGSNETYTMNQIYSAMQTLQDEQTTIDDGTCFSAETPTEYTIGSIDQGDNDPWYITYRLAQRITGGALKTSGWARDLPGDGTGAIGIVVVPIDSASTIVDTGGTADEGDTISHASGDSGTLLEVINTQGATDYLVIRPDTNALADDFNTASGTLTMGTSARTATQNAVATSGEQVWANIYSIGTIEPTVHIYIYQGNAGTTDARERVFDINSITVDWYLNGHIDTTVPLNDFKTASNPTIDDGYLNVYARKGGDLYASFEVANSTTSGGRNPIPLQTAVDLDQGHGTAKIATGAWSGSGFTDGEVVSQASSLARGIVDLTNSTSGSELVYFPIATAAKGGALTAMITTQVITGADSLETATSSGAAAVDGPADASWDQFTGSGVPTITFGSAMTGGYTADVNQDAANEQYMGEIDCNGNPLTAVYEWGKYITGYGVTTGAIATAMTGVDGQEYIGATTTINYSTETGIAEGEAVIQNEGLSTEAKGVVISHNTTDNVAVLRNTRGSFESGTAIISQDDAHQFDASGLTVANFAAKTAAPLGSFAGGTFFGSRGIILIDYAGGDANSFILTDADGASVEVPTSLSFALTNLSGHTEDSDESDRISWFKLLASGGDIDKDQFSGCTAGTLLDDNLDVVSDIEFVPNAGSLILVEAPGTAAVIEHTLRYLSWTGKIFTLAKYTITVTGATTTTVTASGGGFTANAKRGDLVYNQTQDAVSYIKTVDSNTQITLTDAIAGQSGTDTIHLNCLPITVTTSENMYVPYMLKLATGATASTSFIDPTTQIFYRVKVRNTRNATTKLKPYSADGDVTSADVTLPVTRIADTIIT